MNKSKYSQAHDLYNHIRVLNVTLHGERDCGCCSNSGMRLPGCISLCVMVARIKRAENKNLTKAVLIESYGGKRSKTKG